MKKIVVLFLIAALSIMLVSCGDGGSGYSGDSSTCAHSLSNPNIVKDATCTKSGLMGGTCSICGTYATESFSAYGHNMVDGICTVCGESE